MTIIRSKEAEAQIASIQHIQRIVYVLIFTICLSSLVIRKDAFLNMISIPNSSEQIPIFFCRAILFLLVLAVNLKWIGATTSEFNIWLDWLNFVFIKSQVYTVMFGLAVGLGLMFVFMYDITFFSAYYTLFALFNLYSQWLANEYFKRAFTKTIQKPETEGVMRVLGHYWLELPQLGRIVMMIIFSGVSFGIALAGTVQQDIELKNTLHLIAYILTIFTILIAEIVISCWRFKRDKDLQIILDNLGDSSALVEVQEQHE